MGTASESFTAADTEMGLISSTLQTWALSNGAVLAIILLFTQNLLISLYTMLTIVLIVITLMGYLFAVAGLLSGPSKLSALPFSSGCLSITVCMWRMGTTPRYLGHA